MRRAPRRPRTLDPDTPGLWRVYLPAILIILVALAAGFGLGRLLAG